MSRTAKRPIDAETGGVAELFHKDFERIKGLQRASTTQELPTGRKLVSRTLTHQGTIVRRPTLKSRGAGSHGACGLIHFGKRILCTSELLNPILAGWAFTG